MRGGGGGGAVQVLPADTAEALNPKPYTAEVPPEALLSSGADHLSLSRACTFTLHLSARAANSTTSEGPLLPVVSTPPPPPPPLPNSRHACVSASTKERTHMRTFA